MANSRDSRRKRRRRRGRGRGVGIVLTLLSFVVILGAVAAALIVFFEIRDVSVVGQSRYTAAEIVEVSGIQTGKNMFLFNKFSAQSRLFAAFPYLDEVSIRRRLPDTVEIVITQCRPVAVLHSMSVYTLPAAKEGDTPVPDVREEFYLIDIRGKLLEKIGGGDSPELCRISGTSLYHPEVGKYAVFADEHKQKPLFSVLNSLIDHGILQNIGSIDLSETYNISFRFDARFVVKIGAAEDLAKKLRYMTVIITEHLTQTDQGIIDVSSPDTAARFIRGAID